jgi:hypothetical protein
MFRCPNVERWTTCLDHDISAFVNRHFLCVVVVVDGEGQLGQRVESLGLYMIDYLSAISPVTDTNKNK